MPRPHLAVPALLSLVLLSGLSQAAAAQQSRVRCESIDRAYQYCRASTAGQARLERNLSSTRCEQGVNWDVDARGVWVMEGCRGEFSVGRGERGASIGTGVRSLSCTSPEYRYQHCRANTRGQVRIVRQRSNAACVEGRSWGHDRYGVWVDRGCSAEFEVGFQPGAATPVVGPGGGRLLRCESLDTRYSLCGVDTRGEVRLVRVLSSRRCVEGESWGVEQRGIWVDKGCRAEFEVLPSRTGNSWAALGVLVGVGVVVAVLAGEGSPEEGGQ